MASLSTSMTGLEGVLVQRKGGPPTRDGAWEGFLYNGRAVLRHRSLGVRLHVVRSTLVCCASSVLCTVAGCRLSTRAWDCEQTLLDS